MGRVKGFLKKYGKKIALGVGAVGLAGAAAYGVSKLRGRSSGVGIRHKTSSVVKLRNQVLRLKLKKAKIKAQKELWREQMKI